MNKSKLKTYAPQARKDFIAAVTARANLLGLSQAAGDTLEVAPGERKGDIAIIAGREWPAKVYEQRDRLIKHIKTVGFSQTMEAVAYTWFNRFAALRYMEIHDYLDHGHRVLSNREGGMPEILNHATELELPGFNKAKAVELKLAGNKDGELYKMLLVAQCNALSNAMPFLFERIDDETELLLPDNLLRTDSIIAKLVAAIPEEDWQEVEIIGWLYQFYISEKKDEVIGKVVKSEDIPAATQLFTPNWIVQYLVQNSVGRLWLMANPASTLKSQWPYYIQPAEQAPEVQAQLDALIQTRIQEDSPLPQAGEGLGERVAGATLNPESITVLDPACGSGHILVVAYDVLKAIYLERGYQLRAIPRLILEKNLYGLDIDDRAAQLAGFALLMKARADDRRLFDNPPLLNVLALQESKGLDADEIIQALESAVVGRVSPQDVTRQTKAEFGDTDLYPSTLPQMNLGEMVTEKTSGYAALTRSTIAALIDTFDHAKTFGSLIQISQELNAQLATLAEELQQAIQHGDLYAKAAAQDLLPLVAQARVLGKQFDAVVANPPYMGAKFFPPTLKDFINTHYEAGKSDSYGAFMIRNVYFSKIGGFVGMITIPNWMFLNTFESLRSYLFEAVAIASLLQNGRGVFGADFGSCSFVLHKSAIAEQNGVYKKLFDKQSIVSDNDHLSKDFFSANSFISSTKEFSKIPGVPVAYWLSNNVRNIFVRESALSNFFEIRQGLATAENARFLRGWFEVNNDRVGFGYSDRSQAKLSKKKWFPYNKGGAYRRWYGNMEYVVNWENDGQELLDFRPRSVIRSPEFYFQPSVTWSKVTIGDISFRYVPEGSLFDVAGCSIFKNSSRNLHSVIGLLNSKVIKPLLSEISPSVNYEVGQVSRVPYKEVEATEIISQQCVTLAKSDWDFNETSWDFSAMSLINNSEPHNSLAGAWAAWDSTCRNRIAKMKLLEEENNRLLINAYGLQDELSPDVPEDQITLTRADREKDCQRLISYAIGCMMGRYSLDEPGLIYAHAGNVGFDANRYTTFLADADGIVPLTDELWFEDDAANRIREFMLAVWGAETLEENMAWLAESLGNRGDETPEETIRRYLASSFFKNHLQTYKKRPIYWLFSSGKQGAFQALVYLHRYHEGTLARMRSEYVVPLTGKIQSRIEMLTKDAEAATVTSARNKLNKEIETLRKKHVELLSYDEKLRHYADMRITLDLDDGVKVNYGKFGDLLAEVKAVTGGAGDE